MHDRWHRLALPLCLSVFLHGLFFLIVCVPTVAHRSPSLAAVEPGDRMRPLILSISAPPRPRRLVRLPVSDEEYLPVNVQPRLVAPAVTVPAAASSLPAAAPVVAGSSGTSPASPGDGVAGGSGAGNGGGLVAPRPALLGVPPRAQSVVYLIDRSLSMGPSGALERARQELRTAIAGLPPGVSLQVLAYNRTITPLVPSATGMTLRGLVSLSDLFAQMDALTPTGGTDHVAALRRGLALHSDVLFLVTDADDLTEAQVRQVTALNGGRVAVQVVELCRGGMARPGPLAQLAARNGGVYRRVPVR